MTFDPAVLETWARTHAEAATYSVFVMLFLVLAALELLAAQTSVPARRARR